MLSKNVVHVSNRSVFRGPGVGGIEAEAVMLGQSVSMVLPQVVGYRLTGRLGKLTTSTDVVLTITKVLPVRIVFNVICFGRLVSVTFCLQYFNAVGWAAGRASGL